MYNDLYLAFIDLVQVASIPNEAKSIKVTFTLN